MSHRRSAVIAGGGTAGHVFVALAVAGALVDAGIAPGAIELVGSSRGQDATLLGHEGYPLTVLPGRGIVRRLGRQETLDNLGAAAGLAWAALRSVALLVRLRPRVLVSVGGYAAVPVGLAAILLRVPIVLVNTDARPGAAHRLLARFAAASAVAFPRTPLPRAVVTGAPVRADLTALERSVERAGAARRSLGLPADRRTIAVFGGSLGARRLNDAAVGLALRWRERDELSLLTVSGTRNYEEVSRAAAEAGLFDPALALSFRLVAFCDDMAALYQAADLVVCRAGALSVAELAAVGLPAVLVPLPGAPGDHQSANAAVLVDAGAALVVRDDLCDADTLAAMIEPLLADPLRLGQMAAAAAGLGRSDAAAAVAALVQAHAR